MITRHDLEEAIAECQGERNPNANTCIKLAAFYTIKNQMFGEPSEQPATPPVVQTYSGAAPVPQPETLAETYVDFEGESDFSRAINGMDARRAWEVMDELMDRTLRFINPRLYNGVMRQLEQD